ncbi:MAG: regulatory protein RecX [Candidatus Omnitrophota bacterium]
MNPEDVTPEFSKAKAAAFRLIKVRNRSTKELIDRLTRKRFSKSIIDSILQYLQKTQLVDDAQFTKDWIRARLHKPYGLRRIAYELKEKGISDSLAKNAIAQVKADYPEEAIVSELIKKRVERYKNLEKTKIKQRLFNYLANRGFNIDTIERVLNKYDG